MFPSYRRKPASDRQLFILEGGSLYDENGRKVIHCDRYEDIVGELWSRNGLAYVENFSDSSSFDWIYEAVHSNNTNVLCTSTSRVSGIRIQVGRGSRWIVESRRWNSHATIDFINNMRKFYEFMEFGMCPTPSSLGFGLMSYMMAGRHTTLNSFGRRFLGENLFGGRAETYGIGEFFEECAMYDMGSAHLSKWNLQPTGTACIFNGGGVDGFADYFCRVTISVSSELPLGPFPFRHRNRLVYPTLPGIYETFLWKGQIQDCLEAGCRVSIHGGIGWRQMTEDTMPWCAYMYAKRIEARLEGNEFNEEKTKQCTVSAMGRHGVNGRVYTLVPESASALGDLPLCDKGIAYTWFTHCETVYNAATCIHWYSHVLSETSRALYRFALPFAREGRLIATNYDSVIVLMGDEHHRYAKKFSAEHITSQPGTWTYVILHNLTVEKHRTFTSDEYVAHPGRRRR